LNKGLGDFEEFLDKISPLKKANKLGAVLFQLPPSFTVGEFKNVESYQNLQQQQHQTQVQHLHLHLHRLQLKQQLTMLITMP
jgi:uncharacterized protein YecE (DUF72 family)